MFSFSQQIEEAQDCTKKASTAGKETKTRNVLGSNNIISIAQRHPTRKLQETASMLFISVLEDCQFLASSIFWHNLSTCSHSLAESFRV